MDWQKVISSLKEDAKRQAAEGDRFGNRLGERNGRYATSCGATSMVLTGMAVALEAGLEPWDKLGTKRQGLPLHPQAYTLSKAVTGGTPDVPLMPVGTVVFDFGEAGDQLIDGAAMREVTLNPDGLGPSFYVESQTLHKFTMKVRPA